MDRIFYVNKITSLIFSLIVIFFYTILPSFAGPFTDIKPDSALYQSLRELCSKNSLLEDDLTKIKEKLLSNKTSITRYEAAVFLAKFLESINYDPKISLEDLISELADELNLIGVKASKKNTISVLSSKFKENSIYTHYKMQTGEILMKMSYYRENNIDDILKVTLINKSNIDVLHALCTNDQPMFLNIFRDNEKVKKLDFYKEKSGWLCGGPGRGLTKNNNEVVYKYYLNHIYDLSIQGTYEISNTMWIEEIANNSEKPYYISNTIEVFIEFHHPILSKD